jgi:hypothetical protein
MADYFPFVYRALKNLEELKAILINSQDHKANHRVDRLADEIELIGLRFLRGAYCINPTCEEPAALPSISVGEFCSPLCKEKCTARSEEEFNRIREALSEHES